MMSEYMHWVKTSSQLRYNLVSSDLLQLPLSALDIDPKELEIYGPGGYGYPPLLTAIAGKSGVDERSVVCALGTSMANHVAFAALLRDGDEVLLEHPTYELLESTLGYLGARITRFHRRHEDRFAVDPDEIRRRLRPATKLIVLTNLHNPSSAFTDERTLREIGTIAAHAGARVLVDEVYLDAVFTAPPRSAAHLGEQFVTTNSLTKVYGLSGIRCGWVLAEPDLADRMRKLIDLFYSTPAHIAEIIAVRAFARLGALAERSRLLLEANSRLLNGFFADSPTLECAPHEFGLVAFPKYLGRDIGALYSRLRERYETSVAPGHFFGMDGHFRIGIGKETETVREALSRLGRALREETSHRD